jgi:hypothetical protein
MGAVELILHLLNKCVCIITITNFNAQPRRSVPYQSEMFTPSPLGYASSTFLVSSLVTRPSCC